MTKYVEKKEAKKQTKKKEKRGRRKSEKGVKVAEKSLPQLKKKMKMTHLSFSISKKPQGRQPCLDKVP